MLWPEGQIQPGNVTIEGDKVSDVSALNPLNSAEVQPNANDVLIKVPEGHIIAPGYIDLHINGAFGHDFTITPRQISAVARNLPRFGVTSFLPTLISSPLAHYTTACQIIRDLQYESEMATILGLHLEGPYLNRAKAGSHPVPALRSPDIDELLYFDADIIRLMTISPELPGSLPFIRAVRKKEIIVGLGHSTATYDETMAAFEAGASWGNHLFNGMGTLHHRYPGIVGALLTEEKFYLGLIADKVHIHPAVLSLVAAAKRASGVTLVSNAVAAAGMPPGKYPLGNLTVDSSSVGVRLPNGALVGSLEMLDQGVRNMVHLAGRPLAEALLMASKTPAALLGLTTKGMLAPHYDADIIVLNEELKVIMTMVRGQIIYRQTNAQP